MVLSMNTIPKYDIADIVSQISGKMQPADAPSPEGHSFADLLKEAIKSIPESNAEANVAESGRSMPQSPLSEKVIKNQLAGEGVNETELHTLLRQVFLDDSQELAPEVKTDVGEIHRTQLEPRENSDLLAKLRAALNYRTSGPAELVAVGRPRGGWHERPGACAQLEARAPASSGSATAQRTCCRSSN